MNGKLAIHFRNIPIFLLYIKIDINETRVRQDSSSYSVNKFTDGKNVWLKKSILTIFVKKK